MAGAAEEALLDDLNPADLATVVAREPQMTEAQALAALNAAAAAAPLWRAMTAIGRASVLHRAAMIIRDRGVRLAEDIVAELGKLRAEATVEAKTADFFEYYGGLARAPVGAVLADARRETAPTRGWSPSVWSWPSPRGTTRC